MAFGEPKFNVVQNPFNPTRNLMSRDGLIALIAAFKDASFVVKAFRDIDNAITSQEYITNTDAEASQGLNWLKKLKKTGVDKIVCCNLTTEDAGSYNYGFTDAQFSTILADLIGGRFEVLCVPFELESTSIAAYQTFFNEKFNRGEPCGLATIITPNTETDNLPAFAGNFTKESGNVDAYGSLYCGWVTPVDTQALDDSLIDIVGRCFTLDKGTSPTMATLEGISVESTMKAYTQNVVNDCYEYGLWPLIYKDTFNNLMAVGNANTPEGYDIRVIRIYHAFINDLCLGLGLGAVNNINISYPKFVSIYNALRTQYINNGLISDSQYEISKTGLVSVTLKTMIVEQEPVLNFNIEIDLEED